jgi:hypothetical protein
MANPSPEYIEAIANAVRNINARLEAQDHAQLEAKFDGGTPPRGLNAGEFLGGRMERPALGTDRVMDTMGGLWMVPPGYTDNLLLDPTWENGTAATITNPAVDTAWSYAFPHTQAGAGTGDAAVAVPAWYVNRVSGAAQVDFLYHLRRGEVAENGFGSGTLRIKVGASAGTTVARVSSGLYNALVDPGMPNLGASIGYQNRGNWDDSLVRTLKLELYDSTLAAVKATQTLTLPVAVNTNPEEWLTVHYIPTTAERLHDWQVRYTFTVVGDGASVSWIELGEPMLAWSLNTDVRLFGPRLGSWYPTHLHGLASTAAQAVITGIVAGDSGSRFEIGADGGWRLGLGDGTFDARLRRTAAKEWTVDDGAGGPAVEKFVGAFFEQGPNSMDLAITYSGPGVPTGVTRTDGATLMSTTVINYVGALVASVVTTRFGKTITVTPTYTGSDITAIHRAVT